MVGPYGRVYEFTRASGRCPSSDFLDGLERRDRKKFEGSFDALTKVGPTYYNEQRFKALIGDGKPLWVFKEHDHRLYCHRQTDASNTRVDVVLLDGWTKDKEGRNKQELHKVQAAQGLLREFLTEFHGGRI